MVGRLINCRHVGCRLSYKTRVQRNRHEKLCSKPVKEQVITKSNFLQVDWKYICKHCSKKLKYTNNFSRHQKNCKGNPEEKTLKCPQCEKTFQHHSKLKRHEDIHQKCKSICEGCGKSFKRLDHYTKHILLCNVVEEVPNFANVDQLSENNLENDDSFIPSFYQNDICANKNLYSFEVTENMVEENDDSTFDSDTNETVFILPSDYHEMKNCETDFYKYTESAKGNEFKGRVEV